MPVSPQFDDPESDLVLRSSDGVSFTVRALYLRAGSDVFDGMLATKGDGSQDVKLPETADELALLLAELVRGSAGVKPRKASKLKEITTLVRVAEKYVF